MEATLKNRYRSVEGVKLHALAADAISLSKKFSNDGSAFSQYVSDCIDNGMHVEELLYHSKYCFGTADAISYDGTTLSVWDLKTGSGKVDGLQVVTYAAIFCLQYNVPSLALQYDLRIYQDVGYWTVECDGRTVADLMDHIRYMEQVCESHARSIEGIPFREEVTTIYARLSSY
jgi:hypothetical protein